MRPPLFLAIPVISGEPAAMIARSLFAGILLFLCSTPVVAQERTLEGSWALVSDDTIIFRFDLDKGDDGTWSGTWLRPDSFGSDGEVFVRLRGPVKVLTAMAALEFATLVEVSFPDPRPGAVPDIFRFELLENDLARMTYVGTGLEPYQMIRVSADEQPGPWDPQIVYRRPGVSKKNAPDSVNEPTDSEPDLPRPRIGADFLDGL